MKIINLFSKINYFLKPVRKKQIILILFLTVCLSFAELFSLASLIPFISAFINPEFFTSNPITSNILIYFDIKNQESIFKFFTVIFIFFVILSALIKLAHLKMSNKIAENISSDFQTKIFEFYINQPLKYHFDNNSSKIFSSLAQKSKNFTILIFSGITILSSFLTSLFIVTFLIILEPFYTSLILFIFTTVFVIIFLFKSKKLLNKGKEISLNQNLLFEIFQKSVGYISEIILYNLRKLFINNLSNSSYKIANTSAEIKIIGQTPRIYLEYFSIIALTVLIYFLGTENNNFESNLAFLAALAFGAQKTLPLINQIYVHSTLIKSSQIIVSEFIEILNNQNINIEEKINEIDDIKFIKSIELENLYFSYDNDQKNIFNNLNIKIDAGTKIAIKGETGSGKSTLGNIFNSLLEPTKGKLKIDGVEINKFNKRSWQKNVAIVPQYIFLDDSSISQNIAIGIPENEIDFEKVKLVANKAQISNFIEKLPNKYDEKVGERGFKLSGGQRQRIGIARALYRNSKLIIFDEPTNALDSDTENLVLNSISNLENNVTVILITHSKNSLKFCDQIIDLSNQTKI